VEAVLFDLDDTLHDDTRAYHLAARHVVNDVARDFNVDADALFGAYLAQSESFWQNLSEAAFDVPLVGLRARLWQAALLSVAIDDEALAQRCGSSYNDYRRGYLELWPGALELLAALRAEGRKLAMITNGMAETHRDKIALLRLEDAFDEIFIADEVGMVKPDVRLFRLAAERLGVAPERCAMVGDRYDRDVAGAREAGMLTVWMNVRDERVPAGRPAPDVTVTSIEQVDAALRSL
jgi:putative hydrolase of the HAD superfamily